MVKSILPLASIVPTIAEAMRFPYSRITIMPEEKMAIIPLEDSEFISTQKGSTMKLWTECWISDTDGDRWVPLNHSLPRSSFRKAKKILADKGLFAFRPKKSIRDGRETVCWMVKNLHGANRDDYWLGADDPEPTSTKPRRSGNKAEPRD